MYPGSDEMSYRVIKLLTFGFWHHRTYSEELHFTGIELRGSSFHMLLLDENADTLWYTRQVHVHTAVAPNILNILSYRSYGSVDDARTTVFATSIHTTTLTTLC